MVAAASIKAPARVADIDAALGNNTLVQLAQLFAQHGDAFCVHSPLLGKDLFVLSHPDHVRHTLVDNQANFSKGIGIERVAILLGNGLMTSEGALWRSQRKAIQPAFHRTAIQRHVSDIVAANRRLANRLTAAPGSPIDITRELSGVTLEIVLRAIFGVSYDRLVANDNPFALLTADSERDLEFAYAFRKLGALLQQEIERRRESALTPTLSRVRARGSSFGKVSRTREREQSSGDVGFDVAPGIDATSDTGATLAAPDILQLLIDARDRRTGESMSDRQIRDEVLTLIVAGHETTASALSWTWYLIAQHSAVADRIHAEVDAANDAERDRPDATHFAYVQQVIFESLRLYPPGWLLTRRARGAASIAGVDIKPGDDILISPYLVHRHPDYWRDAERFDPDRFTQTNVKDRSRFCYLPFGLGPRACIGEPLALAEMLTHVVTLAQSCRMTLVPGQCVNMEARVNLRPRPAVYVQPARRCR